jgi:hypothetical protein
MQNRAPAYVRTGLLVLLLATQLGVLEGLSCYTYRSATEECERSSPGPVFSAPATRRTVNRLVVKVLQAGYLLGFANGGQEQCMEAPAMGVKRAQA